MATGTDVDGGLRPAMSVEGGSNAIMFQDSNRVVENGTITLIGVLQQSDCLFQSLT